MGAEKVGFLDEAHDRDEGSVVHASAEKLLVPVFARSCSYGAVKGRRGDEVGERGIER